MSATPSKKIALVTGANKGIGREIAAQLAALEMTVLLASRDARRGEETAAALRSTGDVQPITIDVTAPATIGVVIASYKRAGAVKSGALPT